MQPHRVLEHGFVGAADQDAAIATLRLARWNYMHSPTVRLYLHHRPGLTDVQLAVLPQDGQPGTAQGQLAF